VSCQQQQQQQHPLGGPGQQPLQQQQQPAEAGAVPDHVDYGALLQEYPPLVRQLVTMYPLSAIKQRAAALLEAPDRSYAERWEWGDEQPADSSGCKASVDDLQQQLPAAARQQPPHIAEGRVAILGGSAAGQALAGVSQSPQPKQDKRRCRLHTCPTTDTNPEQAICGCK
jgi:hypothetical protein